MNLDAASDERLKLVHPHLAVLVRRVVQDVWALHRLEMRVTDTLRDIAKQKELYAQGRTKPGKIVTWARPGYSWHNYGLAADLCFRGTDPYLENHKDFEYLWSEFGRLARAHGLVWGGDFKGRKPDRPHVQFTFGLDIVEAVELHRVGGMLAINQKISEILLA